MEVYATVITGFEKVAAKEISSKIENVRNCQPYRGNVRFTLEKDSPSETLKNVLKMRSVDNFYVVFYENVIEGLGKMEKEKAVKTLQNEISFMNWKIAIEAWQAANGKSIFGGTDLIVEQMRNFMKTGINAEVTENSPSFRVTCKRAGDKSAHQFSSMDAAWKFGGQINNVFGWRTSMKQFDIEIVMRIERDSILVMIALNNESLFKRNISAYGPTTMRATMCYSMISIADPKPGELIIDPMCGGGSIPIEGACAFSDSFFIGGDNHVLALERCFANLKSASEQFPIPCNFFLWNACHLPFNDNSVDVIVTDLPFGKKLGSVMDNRLLYPKLLEEWKRILKIGGRLVMMTHDKRSIDSAILKDRDAWQTDSTYIVNVGGLSCLCIRLSKI
ncbi:unnamed protein product [Caenorhabditis angaria]|uniref:THUMP domain-containing protein n=1 Tax=Caenorhabditis angaria TaxID=860376 RepID=A0A9P1N5H4_9PELO|nr:unnamed protein product [Caenorhabditis angaria]